MLRFATLTAALLSLAACDREVILVGERLDTRGEAVSTAVVNRSVPLSLPRPVSNAEWSGAQQSHVALNQSIQRVWSASIGEGNSRKFRLSADPVVSGGRIFTLDSRARVTALSTTGATLWTADLTPLEDSNDDSSGGGIAASGNRVFVTSAFGTLTALDAISGRVLWQQNFNAASQTAPTVSGNTVYAVTGNGAGWALDAVTGRILWQVFGVPADRGVLGGGAPAVAGPLVVFPFASGQLIGARADGGSTAWAASVVGDRPGRSLGAFADLTGGP
ncbi:MAG: PQQ-binding-like beta-propeller repeat protein, partial [Pseudomonadota bacterium]